MKNTMRYFSMAVLVLAATMMTSCSKDEPLDNGNGTQFTTTLSMASNGSKALTEAGVKTFAEGDKIAVIYTNTSGNTVKAESEALLSSDIKGEGKMAQFTVTLEDPDKTQNVTYVYPSYMAKVDGTINYDSLYTRQDGTLSTLASKFDYCTQSGAWSGDNLPSNLQLENQLAICKFTVKNSDGDADITATTTKLTIKNGSDIYSVTPSSLDAIYVAVKPVDNGDFKVYAAQGKALYKKDVTGKTLTANTLYTIPVTTTLVPGAVSGLFRVNDDLIYFSQGNLFASVSSGSITGYQFGTNQYTIGETSNVSSNYSGYTGLMGLFGWGNNTNNLNTSTNYSEYGPTGVVDLSGSTDWGNNMGSGWRTPSTGEWQAVFNNHTYGMATVNSVHGIILLPYNTTVAGFNTNHKGWGNNNLNTSEWAAMEAAGAVFLPAAGYRNRTNVVFVGDYGFYWSSTACGESSAWSVSFYDGHVYPVYRADPDVSGGRFIGQSVRLVCE